MRLRQYTQLRFSRFICCIPVLIYEKKFEVKFIAPEDKQEWRSLFEGYAQFYSVGISVAVADETFSWLLNPDHVLEGLIARDCEGRAVGIAHVRACPRPLGGCEVGFLDDMFVIPDSRGSGVADAIFADLKLLAEARGWQTIRWITQHFNERGRRFYDRYTDGPSDFIMYQWNLH